MGRQRAGEARPSSDPRSRRAGDCAGGRTHVRRRRSAWALEDASSTEAGRPRSPRRPTALLPVVLRLRRPGPTVRDLAAAASDRRSSACRPSMPAWAQGDQRGWRALRHGRRPGVPACRPGGWRIERGRRRGDRQRAALSASVSRRDGASNGRFLAPAAASSSSPILRPAYGPRLCRTSFTARRIAIWVRPAGGYVNGFSVAAADSRSSSTGEARTLEAIGVIAPAAVPWSRVSIGAAARRPLAAPTPWFWAINGRPAARSSPSGVQHCLRHRRYLPAALTIGASRINRCVGPRGGHSLTARPLFDSEYAGQCT